MTGCSLIIVNVVAYIHYDGKLRIILVGTIISWKWNSLRSHWYKTRMTSQLRSSLALSYDLNPYSRNIYDWQRFETSINPAPGNMV